MSIFNLKMAMGWDWWRYRQSGWQWWNYSDISRGQDAKWNEAVKTTPSLENILNEITHDKMKYDNIFKYRYGVSDAELNNIFVVKVGYHPSYGVYADFAGPYVGAQASDRLNKYSYFMRRFQRANAAETIRAFNDMMKKHFADFTDALGPDDFKAVVLSETKDLKKAGGKYYGHEKKEYQSLDPNTEEGKRFYQESPMIGSGSYFTPNIYKILIKASKTGNLEGALKSAIQSTTREMGISEQEGLNMLQTNEKFTRKVFDVFRNLQLRAKEAGGTAAQQIKILPDFYVMKKPLIGAQRTDKLKVRPIQFSMLDLRKEILEAVVISKIEDPTKLSEFLNQKRSQGRIKNLKAKGQFTPEIVNYWLDDINKSRSVKDAKGRFSRRKSYAEVLGETEVELNILYENQQKKEVGFPDLAKTLYMMSLFHAEVPPENIDPNTGAKMVSFAPKQPIKTRSKKPAASQLTFATPAFELPENTPIIDSTQLSKWRVERGAEYEGVSEEDIEEPIETEKVEGVGTEEVEGVSGEEKIPEQLEKPVTNKVPVPNVTVPPKTTPSKKAPRPIAPVTEEADITEEVTSKGKAKKVMANTLLSLIRIAKELDSEGKSEASENVHKVIRKYQERINRC